MAWSVPKIGSLATVASGNLTLTEPAGIAQGDLMIACIAIRSTVGFANADWTKIEGQLTGDTDATNGIASGEMWYKVRGASAPSLVFTRTGGDLGHGRIIAYSGGAASPLDSHSSNTLASASTTVTTATISTAEANELIVAMTSAGDNLAASAFDAATDPTTASGATDTTTAPTAGTWIERADDGTNTGADGGLAIADAIRATAGATGTIQATISASARHVMIAAAFKLLLVASLAGVGRATPARATGTLTTRLALSGIGRATPVRGTGILTTRLALSGIGRATPARGKAQLGDAPIIVPLAGIGRATPARGRTTSMTLVYFVGPGRTTAARGIGALASKLALTSMGRATPARGTGQLRVVVSLAGTGRATPARGIGSLVVPNLVALQGTGRATPARGLGDLTVIAGEAPSAGAGHPKARRPLVRRPRYTVPAVQHTVVAPLWPQAESVQIASGVAHVTGGGTVSVVGMKVAAARAISVTGGGTIHATIVARVAPHAYDAEIIAMLLADDEDEALLLVAT